MCINIFTHTWTHISSNEETEFSLQLQVQPSLSTKNVLLTDRSNAVALARKKRQKQQTNQRKKEVKKTSQQLK